MRAVSYGMPGVTVDGTDVLAVYEAAQAAVLRAREGGGPTLLECKTFRWRSHSESRGNPPDPRPASEIELSQSYDPVAGFIDRLVEQGVATSTTTTGSGWRVHSAFTAGGAASLVGAARPFVA